MNKWQVRILGIMTAVICVILFTSKERLLTNYTGKFVGYVMKWSIVIQRGIPVLLIAGLLIWVLKNKNQGQKINKRLLLVILISFLIVFLASLVIVVLTDLQYGVVARDPRLFRW